MGCPPKAGQRHGDGSRCLRDALHRNGRRKFLSRPATGTFLRCEHLPLRQQWDRYCDLDRNHGRHHDIVRGQAGGRGSSAAQPGLGASRGRQRRAIPETSGGAPRLNSGSQRKQDCLR